MAEVGQAPPGGCHRPGGCHAACLCVLLVLSLFSLQCLCCYEPSVMAEARPSQLCCFRPSDGDG